MGKCFPWFFFFKQWMSMCVCPAGGSASPTASCGLWKQQQISDSAERRALLQPLVHTVQWRTSAHTGKQTRANTQPMCSQVATVIFSFCSREKFEFICICVFISVFLAFQPCCAKSFIFCTLYLSITQGAIPSQSFVSIPAPCLPSFTSHQPVKPHWASGCSSMGVLATVWCLCSHGVHRLIDLNTGLSGLRGSHALQPVSYSFIGRGLELLDICWAASFVGMSL